MLRCFVSHTCAHGLVPSLVAGVVAIGSSRSKLPAIPFGECVMEWLLRAGDDEYIQGPPSAKNVVTRTLGFDAVKFGFVLRVACKSRNPIFSKATIIHVPNEGAGSEVG